MKHTIENVLAYWFADTMRKHWFNSTPEIDQDIRQRFETLYQDVLKGKYNNWLDNQDGYVAMAIVLDQLPLNMYRNQAKSFASEDKAIAITLKAIENKMDQGLTIEKKTFLYMPLMHSEQIEQQDISVKLFKKLGRKENLKFAQHHRNIIKEFGRFPHRNSILGRKNTPQEEKYLASKHAFTG